MRRASNHVINSFAAAIPLRSRSRCEPDSPDTRASIRRFSSRIASRSMSLRLTRTVSSDMASPPYGSKFMAGTPVDGKAKIFDPANAGAI